MGNTSTRPILPAGFSGGSCASSINVISPQIIDGIVRFDAAETGVARITFTRDETACSDGLTVYISTEDKPEPLCTFDSILAGDFETGTVDNLTCSVDVDALATGEKYRLVVDASDAEASRQDTVYSSPFQVARSAVEKRQVYYNINQCTDSVIFTPPPSSYEADDTAQCSNYLPARRTELVSYPFGGYDGGDDGRVAGTYVISSRDEEGRLGATLTWDNCRHNDFFTGGRYIVNMEFEDSNSGSSRIADYGLFSIDVPLDNDVCQAGLSGELLVDGDWIRFDMDVASAGPCGGSKIFDTNPDGYRAVLSVNTPSGWLDIARSSEFFTLYAKQIEFRMQYIQDAGDAQGMRKRDRELRMTFFSSLGGEIVLPFTQPDNAPIIENAPPSTYSQLHVQRKREIAAGLVLPSELQCISEQRACPIGGRDQQWECLETMTDINSCGGCWGEIYTADCSALEHVEAVSCVQGICKVLECETGYLSAANASLREQL